MKIKYCISILVLILSLSLVSCSDDTPETKRTPRVSIPITEKEQDVIWSQTNFALNLLSQSNLDGKNTVISPFSLATVLSMIANGSAEDVRQEILATLGYKSDSSLIIMNQCAKTIFDMLPTLDGQTTIRSAQSVWTKGVDLTDNFRNVCVNSYSAAEGQYTSDADGAQKINDWISQTSSGFLSGTLQPSDIGDIMIANTAYFKSQWARKFDTKNTKPMDFTNLDGSKSQVQMMCDVKSGELYQEDDTLQYAIIEYGNGAFRMHLFLPRADKTCAEIIPLLDKYLNPWYWLVPCDVNLKMPRFEFQHRSDMKNELKSIGIEKLWQKESQGMCNPEVVIKKIIHNNKIKVNEEGTIVSSASVGKGGNLAPAPGQKVNMTLDRPFIFFITESSTRAILFAGVVNQL